MESLGRERVLEGLLALSRLRGTIVQWRRNSLQPGPGHAATPGQSCASLSRGGSVMDVASWLRSLGLEQYEATFRENALALETVPVFDHTDNISLFDMYLLEDGGRTWIGSRRTLIQCRDAFEDYCSANT